MIGVALVSVVALALIPLVLHLAKEAKRSDREAKVSLASNGYVVDRVLHRPAGRLTRIWGRFDAPVPFYVQVSNLDPVGVVAGTIGIADFKVGDPHFDARFVVRSNDTARLGEILTGDVRARFLEYGTIRFRTGSLDTLLSVDYFPEKKRERNSRDVWMLEAGGEIEGEQLDKLLAFSRELIGSILSVSKSWSGEAVLTTTFFEGR